MSARRPLPHHPAWLRAWHWANAGVFLILVATGLSLHYADTRAPVIPFAAARIAHNAAGVLLTFLWAVFVVANRRTGNLRHYRLPGPRAARGLLRQAHWYLAGIFRGAPSPYPETRTRKFNPLQAATYAVLMYAWFPLAAGTGWMLLFPELAPARVLGWGGVWPAAVLHLALGFAGTVFLAGHVYLATTGPTVFAHLHAMLAGDEAGEGRIP